MRQSPLLTPRGQKQPSIFSSGFSSGPWAALVWLFSWSTWTKPSAGRKRLIATFICRPWPLCPTFPPPVNQTNQGCSKRIGAIKRRQRSLTTMLCFHHTRRLSLVGESYRSLQTSMLLSQAEAAPEGCPIYQWNGWGRQDSHDYQYSDCLCTNGNQSAGD